MKILCFILTLFLMSPANAFDDEEYQLIDLRRRSYMKKGSSNELKAGQKQPQKTNTNTLTTQPKPVPTNNLTSSTPSASTKPRKVDYSERKVEKRVRGTEEEDTLKYDPKKDKEIKEYLKKNPQALPDV